MSKLPYGLRWYEIGYLILAGLALHYSDDSFRMQRVPIVGMTPCLFYGITLALGAVVLAGRCREQWQKMPNRGLFIIMATAWVLFFAFLGNATLGYINSPSLFSWMYDIFTSAESDEQYALLIPFVVFGLYWWKRETLTAKPLGLWWPGILMMAGALLLHLAGYLIQITQISTLAFLLGIYGLTGLVWGKNWLKASIFPFFLLAFCIPPGQSIDAFTFRLRLLVATIVSGIAHLGLSPDLVREGTQLSDAQHTFAYDVAPACSGIHSLVALLALTIIYGFVSFKEPWKRTVLVVSAIPLAVLGNVTRLCATIIVAELGGQSAGKAVETKLGFVTFAVAIGCMFLIARQLEKAGSNPISPGGGSHTGEVAA